MGILNSLNDDRLPIRNSTRHLPRTFYAAGLFYLRRVNKMLIFAKRLNNFLDRSKIEFNRIMPFEKGKPKTGGRGKGQPNKQTAETKQLIHDIINKCSETVMEDLAAIEPKERLDILSKLMEYVMPKLQRTTVQGDKEADAIKLTVDFKNATTDDLTKLIEATDTGDTDGGD